MSAASDPPTPLGGEQTAPEAEPQANPVNPPPNIDFSSSPRRVDYLSKTEGQTEETTEVRCTPAHPMDTFLLYLRLPFLEFLISILKKIPAR